ncbi:TPA: relaxosome accessory protein [Klebsiella pneumoniae]|nr:relaxosome accessory protein [Klebsiella pneumoniae]OUY91591.1 hypothetical protein BLL04_19645 [Klebsiella variicola]HBZ2695151.1 relaxosome accessory protein [Klebsiella pneumoniae]
MTENIRSNQDILHNREDERPVMSRVLLNLPENIQLKTESDCHVCPNALWFTEYPDGDETKPLILTNYCKVLHVVLWQSNKKTGNVTPKNCDGLMEPEEE